MSEVSVRVTIRGKVQGVFFRASMKEQADHAAVSGWVKNNDDGSVEALLKGRDEMVKKVVEWAQRGPSGAKVDSVEVRDGDGGTADGRFRIVE